MIRGAQRQLTIVEDLIVVRIEDEVPHAGAPSIPARNALERIVENDRDVRIAQIAPAIHVELAHGVHVEGGAHGFVEKLDGGDGRVRGVIVADLVQHFEGVRYGVALGPLNSAVAAAVVEAVLRARG